MPQLMVILVFFLISAPELTGLAGPRPPSHPWHVVGWTLACHGALCVPAWLVIWRCVRRIDRTGSVRAVRLGERAALLLRWASVAVHGAAVFGLGWVGAVRALVGDLVLADEALAAMPVLAVWAVSWWMIEPLERRLHEATILRRLDHGVPVYPVLSRGQYVWMTMRHQVLVLVVPMLAILAWSEGVERAAARWGVTTGEHSNDWRVSLAQLAGVALTMSAMPWILVRIWDTVRLGPGDLRERVGVLCAQARVKVRDVLVWRTNGRVVNAAAVGLLRPLRYILLSDALLDHLSVRQVEAVAAHEIGHVRRRHMLWLGVVMLATFAGVSAAADGLLELSGHIPGAAFLGAIPPEALAPWLLGLILTAAMLTFGFVSRRFEWQADAFAAQSLSVPGGDDRAGAGSGVVTAEAVSAMASALGAVAALSGLERHRFSWRHGSIASRQRRLLALEGLPVARLAIDRQARAIKLGALAVLGASVAWAVLAPDHQSPPGTGDGTEGVSHASR